MSISPLSPALGDPVTITAEVTDDSAVASVEVHSEAVRRLSPAPMDAAGEDTFTTVLPSRSAGFTADEGLGPIDRIRFTALSADISTGRARDGGPAWETFESPTPGEPNR